MNIRLFGAVLVMLGCGSFGFLVASSHRREVRSLQQLLSALDYMQCELQYRMTPLPDLCRQTAACGKGAIRNVFVLLAEELEDRLSPDVAGCMDAVLDKQSDLPCKSRQMLEVLGGNLGRFDLEGQLQGLETSRQACRCSLEELTQDQNIRLRSYKTLGLCAGAALAILLV